MVGVILIILGALLSPIIWPWVNSEVLGNKPILHLNIGKYSLGNASSEYILPNVSFQVLDSGTWYGYYIVNYSGVPLSLRSGETAPFFIGPDLNFFSTNISYEKIHTCPAYVLNLENHGNTKATDVEMSVRYFDENNILQNQLYTYPEMLPGDGVFEVIYACMIGSVNVTASNANSFETASIDYVMVPISGNFTCQHLVSSCGD
jgi:hypothetical protein